MKRKRRRGSRVESVVLVAYGRRHIEVIRARCPTHRVARLAARPTSGQAMERRLGHTDPRAIPKEFLDARLMAPPGRLRNPISRPRAKTLELRILDTVLGRWGRG